MNDPFVIDLLEFVHSESYGPVLRRILEHEDRVLAEGGWHVDGQYDGRPFGWEWHEVGVAPGYLIRLAHAGIVSVVAKSNRHTDYRLTDPELVRKALSGELSERPTSPDEAFDEEALAAACTDLFSPIVGYEDVKDLLLRAITAAKPVHVLLEGPPASAKTLFLSEIGRLPRATFALGGTSSKAGLTDLLLLYRPRYLLVDEIETIDNPRDYAALLHLMENAEVIETKYRRHRRTPLTTWVFATGNDVSKLPPALLSRFGGPKGVICFKEYTSAEFVEIAAKVLATRENMDSSFARRVAEAALRLGSRDVRLAVRVARLCRSEENLAKVVETIGRRR